MKKRKLTAWTKVLSAVLTAVLLMSTVPFTPVYAVNVSTESAFLSAITDGSDIVLTADITLNSWTTKNYSGNLKGDGHVITTPKTLFDTLTGSIENLGVIASDDFSGTSVIANTVNAPEKGILKSFAYGKISTSSTGVVGGMVGTFSNGYIENSFACVDIVANNASHVGGLIGNITSSNVSVMDCYSAGSISVAYKDYNVCKIAGLANAGVELSPFNIMNTYSTCQIRGLNSRAKPSGVNGLYDNQMSIVRENINNLGNTTRELMSTNKLSDSFAVTGTAYPSLKSFAEDKWGDKADAVVRVSTAAASFADVDSSLRVEPSGYIARADYLTLNTNVDRTNGFDLAWSLDNAVSAKVYDTVPLTSDTNGSKTETGSATDLLRSKFVFAQADSDATLTVTSGDAHRTWYLNVATQNPYFYKGSGSNNGTSGNPFWINTIKNLNAVRHYSLIGSYQYQMNAHLKFNNTYFDPIVDFRGNFHGNSYEIRQMKLTNDGGITNVGLFANTLSATIRYITLENTIVEAQAGTTPIMGTLIGKAEPTSNIYRNLVIGASTTVTNTTSSQATGGLIGYSDNSTVRGNLVTAKITGGANCGGIVGEMTGSKKMYECGSTGYIIGQSNLGGLIGNSTSTPVQDCYSTMAVLSEASGTVNAGGLIGNNGGTLTMSYAASLVYAKNGTGTGALVGTGTAATSSYYYGDGSLEMAEMVGTSAMPNLAATDPNKLSSDSNGESWLWSKTEKYMPQITYFEKKSRYATLSAISTTPVYFQKYWNDAVPENMTTGWITKTDVTFNTPTLIESYHDGTLSNTKIYAVQNGWGFEAPTSASCVALCFTQSGNEGIRAVGAARPQMHTLKYTVKGTKTGTNVFVDLGFASSKNGTYQSVQTLHTLKSTSAEAGKVSYDMPSASYVRLKVVTNDAYKVSSVKINGTSMTLSNGYYYSSSAVSADATVAIVLTNATPPWGLRQQHY